MSEYSITFPSAQGTAYPKTVSKTVDYLSENAQINIPSRPDLYEFGLEKPLFEETGKLWVELPNFAAVRGFVNVALSYQLPLIPSATSYVFESLPPGLVCSTSGLITGTPTSSGLFEKTVNVTTPSRVFNKKVLFSITSPASGSNPAPEVFTPNYTGDLYASRTDFETYLGLDPIAPGSNWSSALIGMTVPAVLESQNKAYILAYKPSGESSPRLIQLSNFGSGLNVGEPSAVPAIFAGSGAFGNTNGTGTAASWSSGVYGPYMDSSQNLYVVDYTNQNIRKINSTAQVTTQYTHSLGGEDCFWTGIPTMDSSANFYVSLGLADANRRIGKITSSGVFSVLAGSTGTVTPGYADGTGTSAEFNGPCGSCFDSSGNLFVCDKNNHRIRKITPAGIVTTFAGSGVAGNADGTGAAAEFSSPVAICRDSSDNLYVLHGTRLRKITPAGVVTTLNTGLSLSALNQSLACDSSGNIYQCNAPGNTVRKVTPAGVLSVFAGAAVSGSADGTGTAARFANPSMITIDSSDNLYVYDQGNYTIRKITSAAVVTTLAGVPGTSGISDGTAGNARFSAGKAFGFNSSSNSIVLLEYNSAFRFRSITLSGTVTTLFAGPSPINFGYASGSLNVTKYYPGSDQPNLSIGSTGLVYITDTGNNVVRIFNLSTVLSYDFAGKVSGLYIKNNGSGTGSGAKFVIKGLAVDSSGNVYLVDRDACVVQKVTSTGVVSTLAGLAYNPGSADGTGSSARFNYPTGLSVNSSGEVFVVDAGNSVVRKITPAGIVTTVAGLAGTPSINSVSFFDGIGSQARFNPEQGLPGTISVSSENNVYVVQERLVGTGTYYSNIKRLSKVLNPYKSISSASTFDWSSNASNSFQVTFTPSEVESYYFNSGFYTSWASPSLPSVVSYSASGLPSGLTINSSTGLITGAPTSAVGIYNSVITTNQTYGTVTKGLSINVTPGIVIIDVTKPALRKYSQSYWKEISVLKRGDIVLVPSSYQINFPWGESNVTYDMSYWGEPNVSVPTLPTPPAGFKYKYYIGKNIGESSLPTIY